MENAADALKIAFSIFVFVIALSIAVFVIGQARAASDVIFHFNDKTEFYEYITESDVSDDARIVGMETIIPTIHRYAKEQYAVTIFDNLGKPIVRYDLWTEGIMSDWNAIVRNESNYGTSNYSTSLHETYAQVEDRLIRLQKIVNETLGSSNAITSNYVKETISDLYKVSIRSGVSGITVGASWIGDNNKILQRIKCDMLGNDYENNLLIYLGKDLKQYKDRSFIEKFVELTTSGEIITDEEYSLETVKGNKKLEIIYIMQ